MSARSSWPAVCRRPPGSPTRCERRPCIPSPRAAAGADTAENIGFAISVGYAIFTEWFWRGQTVGKRLLRLRVIEEQGLRLQFSQIVTRNLLRFVDMLPGTMPPARRTFAESIPPEERFLTCDRYWGYYKEESMPSRGEPFYRYELVNGKLREELVGLANRAYCAVRGYGYARVDIRRDTVNGNLSVLEANANCGLSGDDQTSTGSIHQLMGNSYADLVLRILIQTLNRGLTPAIH